MVGLRRRGASDADGPGTARRAGALAGRRQGVGRGTDPLGAHQRAARPDALDVGRRAAADDRASSSPTPTSSARSCGGSWTTTSPALGFGVGFEHDDDPAGDGRGGRAARLPAVRGALRDAVHRDHREGVRAARQRAVRGAPARDRGAPPAGAARARAARAGRGRARALGGDRRRGRGARPARRGDGVRDLPPRDSGRRRSRRSAPRSSERNEPGRAVAFEPAHDDVVGPRARAAGRGRAAAGRACGSSRSATAAASASSSG